MANIAPPIKKGAKGILLFNFFFFKIKSPVAIVPPKIKAEKREIKILGKPKKNPSKKTNFTSPNPNHFP